MSVKNIKTVLLFLALSGACCAHAQEAGMRIGPPDKYVYGYKIMTVDTHRIQPGMAGRNAVWDFSKTAITDSSDVAYLRQAEDWVRTTPHASANYLIYSPNDPTILYLRASPDFMVYLGDYSYDEDSLENRPPGKEALDTVAFYPLYYGKTWTQTGNHISNGNFASRDDPRWYRSQGADTQDVLVDGEGLLTMPGGKAEPALRLRIISRQGGDAWRKGHGAKEEVYLYHTQDRDTIYKWVTRQLPFPATFSISRTHRETRFPNGKTIATHGLQCRLFQKQSLMTLVEGFNNAQIEILSASRDALRIRYFLRAAYPGRVYILDASGKALVQQHYPTGMSEEGKQVRTLHVADLPPGTYYILVHHGPTEGTIRWEKQ